jgi:hypothetical protein
METTMVTADLFISVEGWARGEHSPGYFGYFGTELERWISHELSRPQHVLMGRRTYQALAAVANDVRDEGNEGMTRLTTTYSLGRCGPSSLSQTYGCLTAASSWRSTRRRADPYRADPETVGIETTGD